MAFLWDPGPFLNTSPQESEDRFIEAWLTRQYGAESLADGKLQKVVAGYFNMPWLTQPSQGERWLGEVCFVSMTSILGSSCFMMSCPRARAVLLYLTIVLKRTGRLGARCPEDCPAVD
jgi:hypothetical protein